MSDIVSKREILESLGYGGDPALAERVLEEAGLSRPAKAAVHRSKAAAARAVLLRHFILVCGRGDCAVEAKRRLHAGQGRAIAPVSRADACVVCAGSPDARAVDDMVAACKRAGWQRLCVVGGSPVAREELARCVGDRLQLRLVDGTAHRTLKQARADTAWADRVVVWGGTQLDHRVSGLYRDKVIPVARRGLGELSRAVVESTETLTAREPTD